MSANHRAIDEEPISVPDASAQAGFLYAFVAGCFVLADTPLGPRSDLHCAAYARARVALHSIDNV